jgi:hypothetical protein
MGASNTDTLNTRRDKEVLLEQKSGLLVFRTDPDQGQACRMWGPPFRTPLSYCCPAQCIPLKCSNPCLLVIHLVCAEAVPCSAQALRPLVLCRCWRMWAVFFVFSPNPPPHLVVPIALNLGAAPCPPALCCSCIDETATADPGQPMGRAVAGGGGCGGVCVLAREHRWQPRPR